MYDGAIKSQREVNSMCDMDDRSIIELYFARNEQAIKETADKYGKLCHGIARGVLGNAQDAEECVNDAYLGIWNAIPPTRPDDLCAFVCRVVRNLSLKRLRALTRQKCSRDVVVSLSELEEILPDEAVDGREGEIAAAISAFLREQSVDVRGVFVRKYYFFDSVSAISKRYGFSQSKVKSMLYHTREKLRVYLTKEGIEI